MRTANSISDIYMPVLLNFSDADKLNVIAQLAASLKEGNAKESSDEDFLNCFSGNWENDKSTAEVVAGYRDNSYCDPAKKNRMVMDKYGSCAFSRLFLCIRLCEPTVG